MENDTTADSATVESEILKSDNNPPSEPPVESEKQSDSESVGEATKQGPPSFVERQNSCASTASDCKTPSGGVGKINILLKPVGDAPILKQKLWAVPSERLVSQITEFVKKYLKLEKNQNLFVFVNQLFAPAPDQCIRDLYECFGSDNKLVLHYSTTVAWG